MITINGSDLSLEKIVAVAQRHERVSLDESVHRKVDAARAVVDNYVRRGVPAYGVTTGVGELRDVLISSQEAASFQRNIIHSHACGVGACLPPDVVRAIMLVRLNTLAKGNSGVRFELLQALLELLNRDVHPCVPERSGSGSSGSISAGAHIALVLVGEGEAFFQGERMSGADALLRSGLTPIELAPKEGLSMVSSTHVITGQAALSLANTLQLAKQCDIALALSLEALRGRPDAFDERTHHAKGYLGPQQTAANVRRLIEGSDLYDRPPSTVQDAYTLRCAAQVHGAAREALTFVRQIIESEANSSSDNPLVFVGDDDIVSGGNFHGEAVAIASDVLGIACSELASFSERRTAWLVNHKRTDLPAFLTRAGGLNSGLMIPQYIAVSLVTENLVLAGPASIYSIPTSADQEDFVSSGPIASAKVQTILANAQYVTAIELLCAAQAVDLRSSLRLGRGTFAAHQLIRRDVPFLGEDRILVGNIEHLRDLVHSGELLKVVSDVVGPLD